MATQAPERDGPATRPAPATSGSAPRWVVPAVAGLCALALALRCAIGLRGGVWPDEAQFLFIVGEPSWGAMVDFLRQHESHPPLFYALMRVWLSLTGDSDPAALAVPIALGGAMVPALYAAGSRLFTWRVGLLAAAAGALSPILANIGSMARPYSLLPLLVLGSTYALVRGIDAGGRAPWIAHAVLNLALVYTHNWGWMVVAGQWAATALCVARGLRRPRAAVLRGWAGAQAAVAVGFAPWLPVLLEQRARAGYPSMPYFDDAHTLADWVGAVLGLVLMLAGAILVPPSSGDAVGAIVTWAFAVAALGLFLGRKVRRRGAGAPRSSRPVNTALAVVTITPIAAVAVALSLSARSNLLIPYCLGVLAPLVLLLFAVGLDRWRLGGQARLAAAAAVVVLVAYAVTLPPLWQHTRSNARELAAAVASRAAPSDLVVVTPWWLASPFNRYYQLPTRQIDFPARGRVGAILYDDEARRIADPAALALARQDLAAQHAAGGRVWFVTDEPSLACTESCAPGTPETDNYMQVATLRTAQLRDDLNRLYGPPLTCLRDGAAQTRLQQNVACLFAPR